MAPRNFILLSTYDLGHQPLGVATTARWLDAAGFTVYCSDLAIQDLESGPLSSADIIGLYVPMHTATRLAIARIPSIRAINPNAPVIAFGLYAGLSREALRRAGADATVAGEFEAEVVNVARELLAGRINHDDERDFTRIRRQLNLVPLRAGLSDLGDYVRLRTATGEERTVGRTDTTRGCKHHCRHCPIPPVYGGRFFAIDRSVVLQDIEQLVASGAEHITFGDPDFFNGPMHGLRIARELRNRFPDVTWDCTIKVEHLANQAEHLPELAELGCILITTAMESFDQAVLDLLDKDHSVDEFEGALAATRAVGIALNPTFVAFSPVTTTRSYRDFLANIRRLGLESQVAPIQYTIRLLVTKGSPLVDMSEVGPLLEPFDPSALVYPWAHPDPRVDLLQRRALALVVDAKDDSKVEVFRTLYREAALALDPDYVQLTIEEGHEHDETPVPYLTEPWYC